MKTMRIWLCVLLMILAGAATRAAEPAPDQRDVEIELLRKQVRDKAAEIEKLKVQIERELDQKIEREIIPLKQRVVELEKANRTLTIQLDAVRGVGPAITLIPAVGDETPLAKLIADTTSYIDKTFILVGSVEITDAYSSGYDRAKDTHVALVFWELNAKVERTGESIWLYCPRARAKDLVETLSQLKAKGNMSKLIRAKATILRGRYENNARTAELLDWQFLSKDQKTWLPWVNKTGD